MAAVPPLRGEMDSHLTHTVASGSAQTTVYLSVGLPRTKWHHDPFNRLGRCATIHQRYRQTDRNGPIAWRTVNVTL